MDELPNEVLIIIFMHLHLQQKLKCMLVCRKFAQILSDNGYLFETIYTGRMLHASSSAKERRSAVFEKAESKPQYGKKCNRLLVNSGKCGGLNIVKLAITFPNLRFLYIGQDPVYIPSAESTQADPFECWKNSLETLDFTSRDANTLSIILKEGVFKRLTTINSRLFSGTSGIHPELFSSLHYTPALINLTLESYAMDITVLEMIHSNAPGLTSLTIKFGANWGPVDIQSLDIKPTERMRILNMIGIDNARRGEYSLLEYIKLKYTHLDEFRYFGWHLIRNNGRDGDENQESKWIDIISAIGPRLKVCSMPQLSNYPQLVRLLARIATQLKDLSINITTLPGVVPALPFTILTSLPLGFHYGNFSILSLRALTHLKTLKLNLVDHMQISLNSIVSHLPQSIETLSLEKATITIEVLEPDKHSNIKRLELYNSIMIDTNTSKFLTLYFQQLKSLILDRCTLPNLIDLPNHRLDFLKFLCNLYPARKSGLQLSVFDETYYYGPVPGAVVVTDVIPGEKGDRSLQDVMEPSEKIGTVYYYHFRCASLKTVYYCHYLLL